MAIIQSGATADLLTVDPTSKAARVTLYSSSGAVLTALPVSRLPDPTQTGRYTVASFRTVGLAAANHNLFTIENPAASGKNVGLVGLSIQFEATALSTTLLTVKASRQSVLPTGGTVLTACKNATTDATAVAICRGATASDGGGATAITATISTDIIWSQFRSRMITAVGYISQYAKSLLPPMAPDYPFVLLPGQAVLVQALTAALVTDHYVINCSWVEYT